MEERNQLPILIDFLGQGIVKFNFIKKSKYILQLRKIYNFQQFNIESKIFEPDLIGFGFLQKLARQSSSFTVV